MADAIILTTPIGSSSESSQYATRVDTEELNTYIGQATPGTADSDPLWRIKRVTETSNGDDITVTWASGNANFDKNWQLRTSYVYS